MREVSLRSPVGVLLGLVVLGGLAWPLLGERIETATVKDAAGCPGSGDLPSAEAVARFRTVVACLHNAERAKRSLPALRLDARLNAAAQSHSEDMARRDFFAHANPDGRRAADRIRAAGFPTNATVGENLAWGEESEATPVRIVAGWMNSPGHRENILRRAFSQIGVGIALGAPEPDGRKRAVTYVTTFGGR